jgi:hypothetical protein
MNNLTIAMQAIDAIKEMMADDKQLTQCDTIMLLTMVDEDSY